MFRTGRIAAARSTEVSSDFFHEQQAGCYAVQDSSKAQTSRFLEGPIPFPGKSDGLPAKDNDERDSISKSCLLT
jgi:hypothetical protein